MKMNVKLLRKIQKHIAEEPRRFIMSTWQRRGSSGEIVLDRDFGLPKVTAPECGTVACIRGWADILSDKSLNLTPQQTQRLFFIGGWPKKFRDKFKRSRSPKNRVSQANARIDLFIKTRGAK